MPTPSTNGNPFALLGSALDFGQTGYLTDAYQSMMNGFGSGTGSPPNSSPTSPGQYVPQTPGGNDWKLPNYANALSGLGSTFGNIGDALYPGGSMFGGSGQSSSGGGSSSQTNPFLGGQKKADFGLPGWGSSNSGGFDPWAGNPAAAGMANQLWQGFLQNSQVADKTSDAIWQTMQHNSQANFAYESARAQTSLAMDKIANEKAAVDAQFALASRQLDEQSQQFAQQLKLQSDQLANQQKQYEGQLAFLNSQLASQDALGNKQIDASTAQANAQLQAMLQQMQQQFDLGMRGLDIQDKSATSASDQLALQKWMFEQTQAQQNADRDQKSQLFQLIAGMMGGSGGGTGGGSGGGSGGTGGVGFTGPQGQYGNINVNTGITAGGLNPNAIRAGVSAIEGSGAPAYAGSGPGISGAQQQALGQDLGALNYAGGQMAATDALRTLMPQNANLALTADRTKHGMNLDYAGFVAEQERNRKGQQLGQQGNMLDLLRSMLA